MRKPDEDLKIDISELFGGDVSEAKKSAEVASQEAAPGQTASSAGNTPTGYPSAPATAETDGRYQEWLATRERELELKTQELERRLQELSSHPALSAPSPPPLPIPAQAPVPPPVSQPQAAPMASDEPPSAVDFNAPIAPPFMGPVTAPSVPGGTAAAAPAASDNMSLQEEHEFLILYDQFRAIILHELADLVGEKKTHTMLVRTVELGREKYPEIFRKVNWDPSGNLLEDGSIDPQKVIDNKMGLDPDKADSVLDAALSSLLSLRLQAIEKGLGTGLKNKVRARIYHWVNEKIEKNRDRKKDASFKRLKSYLV